MFGASSVPTRASLPTVQWKTVGLTGVMVLGSIVLAAFVTLGYARYAIGVGIATPLLALTILNVRAGLVSILVYLIILGDLRRMLIPLVGWSGMDPLLLVGSAFSILAVTHAVMTRRIVLDTGLSRWMAAFMAIMVLQIFNPLQGDLIVGVAGIMFMITPMLWYWIGRSFSSPGLVRVVLFRIVLVLSIPAVLMGLYHVFYGYLPYQLTWYDIAGYAALGSRDSPAPISLFASSTEYGNFLIVAATIFWTLVLNKKQRVALIPIVILLVAVFLTGSRGPVVRILFAGAAMWAVLGQTSTRWITRGLIALLIAGVGLSWSLSQAVSIEHNSVQSKLQRQSDGLLNPTDSDKSSVGLHLAMMLHGYEFALREPLGRGIGATTIAARKFGGQWYSTEVGTGNAFVSTGLVGGIIYHVIIFLVFLYVLRLWRTTRSALSLALFGLLTVTGLTWLGGGQYAISTLVWFSVGAVDRFYRDMVLQPSSSESVPETA